MVKDEELERIRNRKLRELSEKPSGQPEFAFTKPLEVTDATFEETIKSHPLVVIDCWASWCAPCRMIAPIIEEMARDYVGRIVFGKLNVDQNRIVMNYQVMSIPTLLIFKNGRLVDRVVGAMSRQALEPRITRHL